MRPKSTAVTERPYRLKQFILALALTAFSLWFVLGLAVTLHMYLSWPPAVFWNEFSYFLFTWAIAGSLIAAAVTLVFLSVPLWLLMRYPVTASRACIAGFCAASFLFLIIVAYTLWLNDFRGYPADGLVSDIRSSAVFMILISLSAVIIQRIIGPGAPAKDIAKVFE